MVPLESKYELKKFFKTVFEELKSFLVPAVWTYKKGELPPTGLRTMKSSSGLKAPLVNISNGSDLKSFLIGKHGVVGLYMESWRHQWGFFLSFFFQNLKTILLAYDKISCHCIRLFLLRRTELLRLRSGTTDQSVQHIHTLKITDSVPDKPCLAWEQYVGPLAVKQHNDRELR